MYFMEEYSKVNDKTTPENKCLWNYLKQFIAVFTDFQMPSI